MIREERTSENDGRDRRREGERMRDPVRKEGILRSIAFVEHVLVFCKPVLLIINKRNKENRC